MYRESPVIVNQIDVEFPTDISGFKSSELNKGLLCDPRQEKQQLEWFCSNLEYTCALG